jgi:FAD:protein FMN transferase
VQYYQESVALGSKTGLSLVSRLPNEQIEPMFQRLWRAIFTFERRFSRFLPNSELSIFNRKAGFKQSVSPEFRELLIWTSQIAQETQGLFNPFVLPAVQSAGYLHSRVPGHESDITDDHSNKSVVPADDLSIGDDWAQIPIGTALDLGGCGKGYLAEQLQLEIPASVTGYWLSLGGDMAIGGRDPKNRAWKVSIESADDKSKNIGTLTASRSCGIATSGTTVLTGTKDGKPWHHLIDPRTHKPAETDVLLATVYDKSPFRADVLASCAVILGKEKGLQFLKDQKVQAAVLQTRSQAGNTSVVHFGNAIIIDNA